MKTKLRNMLGGKERRKEKNNRYAIKQRQMKIYIHLRLTARGKEQQERQTKE